MQCSYKICKILLRQNTTKISENDLNKRFSYSKIVENIAHIAAADLRVPSLMRLVIPLDFVHVGQKLLESRNFEGVCPLGAKDVGHIVFDVDASM